MEFDRNLRVSEKIRRIISKYFDIEVFKEDMFSFTPICIIKTTNFYSEDYFNQVQIDFRKIGFQVKLCLLSDDELKKYNLEFSEKIKRYIFTFEPKEFLIPAEKLKKYTKIQIILLSITSLLVVFSAFFYIYIIEPYWSYHKNTIQIFWSIFSFCIGMFLIIVVHEFGHVFFARYHKLRTSLPFLIPGPPPIGMLGAFVSIRDDPQTRNQKFDVAVGGLIFGILISILLLVIGLLLSEYVDTETYIHIRAAQSHRSPDQEAKFINDNINSFNLLFLAFRYLFYEQITYGDYYNYNLPNKILVIHPLAYAGWIGLLISALNLLPIPMLDGGHILKAIFPGRFTRLIGLLIGGTILFILTGEFSLLISLGMIGAFSDLNKSKKYTEIPNPTVPLKRSRKILALSLIGIFVLLYPLSFDNLIYGIGF